MMSPPTPSSVVRITDVSPRDGLQSEDALIGTDRKLGLVRAAQAAGADEVEVSSFVSPRWIPQLGDAPELFAMIAPDKREGVCFSALVPNERGLEGAIEANRAAREAHGIERLIDKVSVFTAATEGFALKNTNATIEETLERFGPLIPRAHEHGMRVRGYISCVVRCPYDGDVSPSQVGDVAGRLLELGVDEIDLGDTIGAAEPDSIEQVIIETIDRLGGEPLNGFGDPSLTLHLHDTFGRAKDCAVRAMEIGVRSFDASSGGLGGCPYASTGSTRAPGNISMVTLLSAIEEAGLSSAMDRERVMEASRVAMELVG